MLLGYVVSEKGREPDPEKIAVIDEFEAPNNTKGIAKLLGHVGWYRELIPSYAKIVLPITHLLKKDVKFEWTEECQRAFSKLKAKHNTYPVLVPPNWSIPFHILCDANAVAVGSALCQPHGELDKDQLVVYASRN